jgi:transketolase
MKSGNGSMAAIYEAPALIGSSGDSLREAFGKALSQLADEFANLVVLDADIAGGTGTHHIRRSHPQRFLQFGIAEQNMMAAAGGLAAVGMLPVVTTFAVFCLRGLEQARLSIAYARRNAKIVASHPGLDVGPDGGSAQALEDLAAFRAIPGMTVISPADAVEMRLATRAILEHNGPVYMRSGRSPARRVFGDDHVFAIGKGQIVRDGSDVTIVACGVEVARALEAAEMLASDGIAARVVNMATIKPIDRGLLVRCAEETGAFVTAEDHNIYGGLGGAVAEALAASHPCPIEFVGVKDVFGASGEPEELADAFGLSAPHIARAARTALSRKALKIDLPRNALEAAR